jgi:DNA-binding transcriptional LysR family regulator
MSFHFSYPIIKKNYILVFMKLSHLNGLKAFEATVRNGSLRAAARELGVTPAAVGQQVRTLEEFVGRSLFYRKQTGVEPNELAIGVAGSLTSSFSAINDVLTQLGSPTSTNRLAVTMTQALAENWLPPRLSSFFAMAPGVDLRIDTTHLMVDLFEGEFDFAIRFMPPASVKFDEVTLFPGSLVPVCSPEFAQRYKLVKGQKTLSGVPLCSVEDHTSDPLLLDWRGWCERFNIELEEGGSSPQFSHLSSGVRVAKAGLGLILGGLVECIDAIADGSLVMPFGPESIVLTKYNYRLLSVRGRKLSPFQANFRSWIIERAEDHRHEVEKLHSIHSD